MAFPIRGLPEEVVETLDQAAQAAGVSRNAYLVDLLTEHARRLRPTVTVEEFLGAIERLDLDDEELMRQAWR